MCIAFGFGANSLLDAMGKQLLMSRPSEVAKLLQELGTSADEVALALKLTGIQGVRNTVRLLNPIVRYVEHQVPDVWNLNVMTGASLSMNFRDGGKADVALPEAVGQFLAAFNRGAYPELELPPDKGSSGIASN